MSDGDPDSMAPADETAGVELTCEKCDAAFQHEGRGRRPKRCPECRTTRAPATESAPKRPRGIESLESSLHGQLTMLGAGLLFLDPFDGAHVMKKAEKGAKVLSNLAATNPSIRRGLEKGVEMAGWGPVLLWGTEVMLPILAHHGALRGVVDPAKKPQPAPPVGPDVAI